MKISNWAKLDLLLLACRRQITPEGISVFDDDQWVQCSEKYIRRDVNFSGVWRVETVYKNTQYDGYYMLEGMGGPHTAWHEREDGKYVIGMHYVVMTADMCKKYMETRMMLDQDDGKNLPCHPF